MIPNTIPSNQFFRLEMCTNRVDFTNFVELPAFSIPMLPQSLICEIEAPELVLEFRIRSIRVSVHTWVRDMLIITRKVFLLAGILLLCVLHT